MRSYTRPEPEPEPVVESGFVGQVLNTLVRLEEALRAPLLTWAGSAAAGPELVGAVAKIARFASNNRVDRFTPVVPGGPVVQSFTANEAKTRFGEFLDRAQREPVAVTRHDRVVGVLVSAQDYEEMRAFYANRLVHTLDVAAQAATGAGLTPRGLTELLADDR